MADECERPCRSSSLSPAIRVGLRQPARKACCKPASVLARVRGWFGSTSRGGRRWVCPRSTWRRSGHWRASEPCVRRALAPFAPLHSLRHASRSGPGIFLTACSAGGFRLGPGPSNPPPACAPPAPSRPRVGSLVVKEPQSWVPKGAKSMNAGNPRTSTPSNPHNPSRTQSTGTPQASQARAPQRTSEPIESAYDAPRGDPSEERDFDRKAHWPRSAISQPQ